VVGVTQRELDYWAKTDLIKPSIKDANGRQTKRLYSIGDFMRLATMKNLRSRGLSLQKIRKVVDYLKGLLDSEKPLEDFELKAEKGSFFILTEKPEVWLDIVRRSGQLKWLMVKETSREVEDRIKSLKYKKTLKKLRFHCEHRETVQV